MVKIFNLQLFAEGGDDAGSAGNSGTTAPASSTKGNGGYSFEQAEEIANARAQRAEKAALSSYFKQQGLDEEQVKTALAEYKAKKEAEAPNVSKLTKERDEALAKLAEKENNDYLKEKGVKAEDLDYVTFKANQGMDEKTDFKKAADAFLKENPRFVAKGSYTVQTGVQAGGNAGSENANDAINNAIRNAFRR